MSLTRAIAKNTFIQVSGKIVSTVLGLLTVAVMTRHLGKEGYGVFTTIVSFMQFFGILVDFGLTLTMLKLISEDGADEAKITSNVFTIRFVSGLVFFTLAPIIALFFPYPPIIKFGIAIVSLSFFSIVLSQVLTGIFQKHLAIHRASIAEVVGRLVLFVGVTVAALYNTGILVVIIVLVTANFIQFLLNFLFARSYVPIRLAYNKQIWKKIIHESWPVGLSIAFNLIYLKSDVILLSIYKSQAEVGLYGASYKVLDVITVIPMMFMGLVLPIITNAWSQRNFSDFTRKFDRAFDFLSLMALPLMFGAFAVSRDLMRFVAGRDFIGAGVFLAILIIAGGAVFWGSLFGHTAIAVGLQRKMVWFYAIDAIVSLVLYLTFIPQYGGIAAAWVTVFSELFIAVIGGIVISHTIKHRPSFSVFFRAGLASILMYFSLIFFQTSHVLLRIGIGAVVYVFFLIILKVITKELIDGLRGRPSSNTSST